MKNRYVVLSLRFHSIFLREWIHQDGMAHFTGTLKDAKKTLKVSDSTYGIYKLVPINRKGGKK